MLKEKRRGAIEERMPGQLAAADKAHELQVDERLHDRVHRYAANLLDLALRDRLAVGDDRERLQRGAGESVRTVQLQERAHVASARGRGLQTVRATRAHEAEPAAGTLQFLLEAMDRLLDLARRAALVHAHHLRVLALFGLDAADALAQIGNGKGRLRGEEQRTHDLLQRRRQGDLRFLRLRHRRGLALLLRRSFCWRFGGRLDRSLNRRLDFLFFRFHSRRVPQVVCRPASPSTGEP